jgi:hypothetical protein
LKSLLVGLKEQVSHGVLAQGRQLNVLLLLKVLDEEPVGDGCHDTSTITISCVRAHGTTMGHVAEKVTGITDNLVARLALDVASKTDTASILLIRRVIETLLHRQGTSPRVIVVSLILIRYIWLLLGFGFNVSVVKVLV